MGLCWGGRLWLCFPIACLDVLFVCKFWTRSVLLLGSCKKGRWSVDQHDLFFFCTVHIYTSPLLRSDTPVDQCTLLIVAVLSLTHSLSIVGTNRRFSVNEHRCLLFLLFVVFCCLLIDNLFSSFVRSFVRYLLHFSGPGLKITCVSCCVVFTGDKQDKSKSRTNKKTNR